MRPLLIGENNPQSLKPGHELYPLPEGCAGNRLWHMIDDVYHIKYGKRLYPSDYLNAFERRNLVIAREFNMPRARLRAGVMMQELLCSSRQVVLLGRQVQKAFGLPPFEPLTYELIGGCRFYAVPHPSGRNMWFNDEKNRVAAGNLLLSLMESARAST